MRLNLFRKLRCSRLGATCILVVCLGVVSSAFAQLEPFVIQDIELRPSGFLRSVFALPVGVGDTVDTQVVRAAGKSVASGNFDDISPPEMVVSGSRVAERPSISEITIDETRRRKQRRCLMD